jgi:hypothetical protein
MEAALEVHACRWCEALTTEVDRLCSSECRYDFYNDGDFGDDEEPTEAELDEEV